MNKAKKKNLKWWQALLLNNRFWILLFSFSLSVIILAWILVLVPSGDNLRIIGLQQSYGFIGLIYLYFALLATPLTKIFSSFPYRTTYLHARRAIGVSAFYFSMLHFCLAFFGQLNGFQGLQFLSVRYNLALILGFVGLLILMAMALTSFDKVIDRMGFPRWKRLHRLIYFGGLAIMIHIVMLGTHYAYGSSVIARITFGALLFLLILEAIRLDISIKQRWPKLQHLGIASMVMLHILFLGVGFLIGKSGIKTPTIAVHGDHQNNGMHEQYVKFDPIVDIDGRTIRINQKKLSRTALTNGEQLIQFRISNNLTSGAKTDCFMVNQKNFTYVQGFTKNYSDYIDCLPIGDINPPQPGSYTIYLRITENLKTITAPFSLEITP